MYKIPRELIVHFVYFFSLINLDRLITVVNPQKLLCLFILKNILGVKYKNIIGTVRIGFRFCLPSVGHLKLCELWYKTAYNRCMYIHRIAVTSWYTTHFENIYTARSRSNSSSVYQPISSALYKNVKMRFKSGTPKSQNPPNIVLKPWNYAISYRSPSNIDLYTKVFKTMSWFK